MPKHRLATVLAALLIALGPAVARAAWPHDPFGDGLVLGEVGSGPTVACVADGEGGTITLWDEGALLHAQRMDAHGNALWGPGGRIVVTSGYPLLEQVACSDGAGGVLVAYLDSRVAQTDISVQRIDAQGNALWGTNGVLLCGATGFQLNPRIASLGTYGAVVAWEDPRSGFNRIYAQRVSLAGAPQWTSNGVELGTSAAGQQQGISLAGSPDGSCVAAWQDSRTDAGDIYTQRLSVSGSIYTTGGRSLCNATNLQSEPVIARSTAGGYVIAWVDVRGATSADIYAQRLGEGYNALWTANGVAVCQATGAQVDPRVIPGPDGVFVAWRDERSYATTQDDVYAQNLSLAGAAQWTVNGIAICTASGNQSDLSAAPDGAGGFVLSWLDDRTLDSSNFDVYAQRLTSTGSALWTAGGTRINTSWESASGPRLCSDGAGGAIVAWSQYANSAVNRAEAAHVDEWGYLGGEPVPAGVTDVPNDQGGFVKVSWDASPLDTDPLFRNVSSYWLYRSVPAALAASRQRAGAVVATLAGAVGADTPPRLLQTRFANQDLYWEFLTSTTATHLDHYSDVVPTTGDSTAAGNPATAFMVVARNSNGSQWWESAPDSGYSVDDLAPAAPAPLTGQYVAGTTTLHWNPNVEPDVAAYEVHRGHDVSFVPDAASLVATSPDTGYADAPGAPFVYKVVAVDVHGNRSPAAVLVPAGTLGVDAPAASGTFFAPPSPNPSRAGTTLRFGLATAGRTHLALYDAQGRLVRQLFDGPLDAGEHALAFDGRDRDGRALAPGLYLARLTAPGLSVTRRLARVE